MTGEAVRKQLDDLIRRSGQGYAEISRLVGRNAAYIQQFIKRGVPRHLREMDRRILAAHFNVSESVLGGPPEQARLQPESARHSILDIRFVGTEEDAALKLDSRLLSAHPSIQHKDLAVHAVVGDSMAPTLLAGDHVLIDRSETAPSRDGLFLLDSASVPTPRRLSINPVSGRVTILTDNAAYPSYPDCDPQAIRVIGRIIWTSRRLS